MKNLIFILLMSVIGNSALQAAEEIALKPISMPSEGQTANPFSMTVTGSGKMIPKPGAVSTGTAYYEDTLLPYLVSTPKPIEYPRWAMRQGWQGSLVIALEILLDGRVGQYQVMQSTGYRLLDEAAIEAIRTWKFAPATQNGKPVLTCIELPVNFQLEN